MTNQEKALLEAKWKIEDLEEDLKYAIERANYYRDSRNELRTDGKWGEINNPTKEK